MPTWTRAFAGLGSKLAMLLSGPVIDEVKAARTGVMDVWRRTSGRRRAGRGGLLGAAGVGVISFAAVTMSAKAGNGKVALVLAGVIALYLAVNDIGKGVFGPSFDTSLWLSVGL